MDGGYFLYPPPPTLAPEFYERINLVSISHFHSDHCNLTTLKRFRPETEIVIPREKTGTLREILSGLGFRNLIELEDQERMNFGDFSFTMFHSDVSDYDSVVLVEANDVALFPGNDCLFTAEKMEMIGRRHKIHLAFLAHGGGSAFPACYEFDEETKQREALKKKEKIFRFFVEAVEALRPRYTIPYAGGFVVLGEHVGSNYLDRTTPYEAMERARELKLPTECVCMSPGDTWDDAMGFSLQAPVRYDRAALDDYYRRVKDKYEQWEMNNPNLPLDDDLADWYFSYLREYAWSSFTQDLWKTDGEIKVLFGIVGRIEEYFTLDLKRRTVMRGSCGDWAKKVVLRDNVVQSLKNGTCDFLSITDCNKATFNRRPPERWYRGVWESLQEFSMSYRQMRK